MKIIQAIAKGIFMALLLGVAGLFVISLLPIHGNIEIKIVKSGSMEPAVMTGSIVVIQPNEAYQVGDIITFGTDSTASVPTTHRIVSVRESGGEIYYTTKGDANEEADPEEAIGQSVIGRMLFTVPYAGFILDFARQPLGFALLIGLPAVLIVLYELVAIWGEIRAMMKRRRRRGADGRI